MAIVAVAALSLIIGAIPGVWLGLRGHERSRGHLWLAGFVVLLAIVAVTFYTVGGVAEELFSRVVMLPLTLLIAIAGVAAVVGVPMYAGYLCAYRIASSLSGRS